MSKDKNTVSFLFIFPHPSSNGTNEGVNSPWGAIHPYIKSVLLAAGSRISNAWIFG
jgi:hypothetical protein